MPPASSYPQPQVGSIINFAAVYLLAPVPMAAGGAASLPLASKIFGDYYLNAWGAPRERGLPRAAGAALIPCARLAARLEARQGAPRLTCRSAIPPASLPCSRPHVHARLWPGVTPGQLCVQGRRVCAHRCALLRTGALCSRHMRAAGVLRCMPSALHGEAPLSAEPASLPPPPPRIPAARRPFSLPPTAGLGAGVVGTTTSNGLLQLRKKLDPNFKPVVRCLAEA